MLDKKVSEVSTIGSFGREEMVKVSDINACTEVEDHGDFKIEFPYEITLVDSEGEVILKEKTQGVLRAKDWNKKFYLKESANGNKYVAYSRYMSLLAIITIMTKVKGELPPKLDLNKLIDFEFKAVIIDQQGAESFIDWVGTFLENGISVPSEEELGSSSVKAEVKETPSKKGAW